MNLSQENLMKLGIALGVVYAAWKFGPAWAKAGALGVGAVIVAKQVPYVKEVL
jgi:hypothetical protein